jgi:hypothetical protein
VKFRGSTPNLHVRLEDLSMVGASGIPGVAVECVDIGKNIGGEGDLLGHMLTLRYESVGSKQD